MPTFRRIDQQGERAAQHLRLAARLILRSLPSPSGYAVSNILKSLTKAYQTMPMQRIVMAKDAVEKAPMTRRAEVLRAVHVAIEQILDDLGQYRVQPTVPQEPDVLTNWLQAVGDKGWRVAIKSADNQDECADGFELSAQYLDSIVVEVSALLTPDQQYGTVDLPCILMQGYSIPKQTLQDWSCGPGRMDVTVVYGQYIAVKPVRCIGILADLLEMRDGSLALSRVNDVAEVSGVKSVDVVPAPRRLGHHYYCPVFDAHDAQRRFFMQWHPLVTR